MTQPHVSFNDDEFEKKMLARYIEDGYVVITDVFSEDFSNHSMDKIVSYMESLGSGLNRNDLSTWTDENCPPQTRPGLFQALLSNIPRVWEIRANKNVRRIFEVVYSHFRGKSITDFIVSGDGINIRPNGIGPYYSEKTADWAHIDIREKGGKEFYCTQGQAVLTDTTATFRCTPGSHKIYEKVLDLHGINDTKKSDWCKIAKEHTKELKSIIEDQDGKWQIPVYAPKGSFIIWSSATIHSAKLQDAKEDNTADFWKGWRGIVYVCYLPRGEVSKRWRNKRLAIVTNNRTSNHWAEKMFGKKPTSNWRKEVKYHHRIEEYIKNHALVYDKVEKTVLNKDQMQLV